MEGSPIDCWGTVDLKGIHLQSRSQQAMVIRAVCPRYTSSKYKKNGRFLLVLWCSTK
jgi:hypothetical protein